MFYQIKDKELYIDLYDIASLENKMVVTTTYKYIEQTIKIEDEIYEYMEEHYEECDLLSEIISIEVSIFVMRRIGTVCESLVDAMNRIWHEKVIEYSDKFKKEYIYYNKDIDW